MSLEIIPKHLAIALNYIGTAEAPGPLNDPDIVRWLKSTGMPAMSDDDEAWCAAMVNGILLESGIDGTGKPNARSYEEWGYQIHKPKLGCIVVLTRGKAAWAGHVGFYLDEYHSRIKLLGGNQNNRVGINDYHTDRLLSYRWDHRFDTT